MSFVRSHAKAIVGVIVTAAVSYAATHGIHVDKNTETAVSALVVGFLVYLVPNKP